MSYKNIYNRPYKRKQKSKRVGAGLVGGIPLVPSFCPRYLGIRGRDLAGHSFQHHRVFSSVKQE